MAAKVLHYENFEFIFLSSTIKKKTKKKNPLK